MKLIVQWIRTNNLSSNTSKTKLVIFKPKNKIVTKHISGQKIKPSLQVKYLQWRFNTPLNLNHDHDTHAAINHLDIPQTCHYGTFSMVFTASKIWSDILRKSNKDLLYCEWSAFKKTIFQRFFSKYESNNWTDWAVFSKTAIHGGY